MTLAEQSGILLEAIGHGFLRLDEVVQWADEVVVRTDKPPGWIIELSTLCARYVDDFVLILRERVSAPVPLHRRIQVVVLAYEVGRLSLPEALSRLFQLILVDRERGEQVEARGKRSWVRLWSRLYQPTTGRQERTEQDALRERLLDALVRWDCQEDLDVILPELRAAFEALFAEYLADAGEIASMLRWKHEEAA